MKQKVMVQLKKMENEEEEEDEFSVAVIDTGMATVKVS